MELKSILERIKNEEVFTERELWDLIDEYEVENIKGDSGRWNQDVTTIIQLEDKFYGIHWGKGLTECQEHYMPEQSIKECKKVKKVIEVEEWEIVEK